VVVLAAIVAFVGTRQTDSADETPGLEQTQPVEVDGTALPRFDQGTDPAVGEPAPELRGASFDGTPVVVSHDGRPKLILFVAHWCPHCQREVPFLADHLASQPLPAGIDLVTVATSTDPASPNYPPSAWLASEGWTTPTMADSDTFDAATAYGLSAFPFFVAVDADGNVVERASGELTADAFDALVQAALGDAST
jgi:thiol-disulfide isomerase/thioredoxin